MCAATRPRGPTGGAREGASDLAPMNHTCERADRVASMTRPARTVAAVSPA